MTLEEAVEKMQGHGYIKVFENGNGEKYGFVKNRENIRIEAVVFLNSETVTLEAGILKMSCKLSCEKFDINSNKFGEFENILYLYAVICSNIDNLIDAEGIIPAAFESAKKQITTEDSLKKRLLSFKKKVITVGKNKKYTSSMCHKFFDYWSEVNDNGKLMRWEIQKRKSGVFNVERRMATWYSKDKEDFNSKNWFDKKADKQNEDLKKENTLIDKKQLFG